MNDRQLQDPSFNQLLQRRFGVTDAPSVAFAPEVFPVASVLPFTADLEYLLGVRRCGTGVGVAPVVGQNGFLEIRNPTGSGLLIVIRKTIVGLAGSDVSWLVGTGTMGAGVSALPAALDTRWAPYVVGVQQSAALATTGASAVAPVSLIEVARFSGSSNIQNAIGDDVNVTLKPGSSFVQFVRTVNIGFTATVTWTERRAQPSEL